MPNQISHLISFRTNFSPGFFNQLDRAIRTSRDMDKILADLEKHFTLTIANDLGAIKFKITKKHNARFFRKVATEIEKLKASFEPGGKFQDVATTAMESILANIQARYQASNKLDRTGRLSFAMANQFPYVRHTRSGLTAGVMHRPSLERGTRSTSPSRSYTYEGFTRNLLFKSLTVKGYWAFQEFGRNPYHQGGDERKPLVGGVRPMHAIFSGTTKVHGLHREDLHHVIKLRNFARNEMSDFVDRVRKLK